MKNSIKKVGFILVLFSMFYSCVNVKNKKEIKEIQLKIIITDKIGQVAGDKLPVEIDSLFIPIEPAGCPKVAFLPKVEIIRFGLPQEYHQIINTDGSGWKTFFQKFYGNTGVETRKSNIKNVLGNFTIGDSLVIENSKNFILSQTIEKVLLSNPTSQFYIYKPNLNRSMYNSGNKEIVVFKNVKTLVSAVGKQLCEKQGVNQKIVVFYNPKLEAKVDSIQQVKQDTLKNEGTIIPAPKPEEKHNQVVKPHDNTDNSPSGGSGTTSTQGKTITLPNGDRYVGEVKNNKPNGWGTVTFSKSRLISDDDPKKTIAEAGDHFTGVWVDGKPQSGKLTDSKNNPKSTLVFGVAK